MKDKEKQIGKFNDASALLAAYTSLEKEFTKRCQRIKELENKLSKDNIILTEEEHYDFYKESFVTGYDDGVKKFVKSLSNYNEFLLRADANGALFYVDFIVWLHDVAKQLGVEIKE